MNPINRLSQKIVCIDDGWGHAVELLAGSKVKLPILNEVFTVDGFVPCPACYQYHYLLLVERPKVGTDLRLAFAIKHFSPVDERKTDIGDLQKIGRDTAIDAAVDDVVERFLTRVDPS